MARQVTAVGRSRAYLGGAQVPAPVCARVTEALIAIHGQSEQVRLTAADRQRILLDRFAGDTVASVLGPYAGAYAERRAAATELERLRAEAQSRAREIDVLRFGLTEIEQVDARGRRGHRPGRRGGPAALRRRPAGRGRSRPDLRRRGR